jgi:hypothetical protein
MMLLHPFTTRVEVHQLYASKVLFQVVNYLMRGWPIDTNLKSCLLTDYDWRSGAVGGEREVQVLFAWDMPAASRYGH